MSRCAHLRCFDFVAFPCSIGFAFIAFFLGMGSQGFCVFCRRRPSELDENVAMYPHERFSPEAPQASKGTFGKICEGLYGGRLAPRFADLFHGLAL